jgi:hypothetical protein
MVRESSYASCCSWRRVSAFGAILNSASIARFASAPFDRPPYAWRMIRPSVFGGYIGRESRMARIVALSPRRLASNQRWSRSQNAVVSYAARRRCTVAANAVSSRRSASGTACE